MRDTLRIAASSMEPDITTIMQQKKQFHKSLCKHVNKQEKQIAIYTNVIDIMPAVFFFQYEK